MSRSTRQPASIPGLIGYANKPGKADQLRLASANAITGSMTVIAQAARANNNRTGL